VCVCVCVETHQTLCENGEEKERKYNRGRGTCSKYTECICGTVITKSPCTTNICQQNLYGGDRHPAFYWSRYGLKNFFPAV
jgi:hypothetical protein